VAAIDKFLSQLPGASPPDPAACRKCAVRHCTASAQPSPTASRRQQGPGFGARGEIEADLTDARRRFTSLAAMAMFGDASQGGRVLPRLDTLGRTLAGLTTAQTALTTARLPFAMPPTSSRPDWRA